MNVVGMSLMFAEMLSSGGLTNSVLWFHGRWKKKENGGNLAMVTC
jgi:hypothetical protein